MDRLLNNLTKFLDSKFINEDLKRKFHRALPVKTYFPTSLENIKNEYIIKYTNIPSDELLDPSGKVTTIKITCKFEDFIKRRVQEEFESFSEKFKRELTIKAYDKEEQERLARNLLRELRLLKKKLVNLDSINGNIKDVVVHSFQEEISKFSGYIHRKHVKGRHRITKQQSFIYEIEWDNFNEVKNNRLKSLFDLLKSHGYISEETRPENFFDFFNNTKCKSKINWLSNPQSFYYFIQLLKSHPNIAVNNSEFWKVAMSYFHVKDEKNNILDNKTIKSRNKITEADKKRLDFIVNL